MPPRKSFLTIINDIINTLESSSSSSSPSSASSSSASRSLLLQQATLALSKMREENIREHSRLLKVRRKAAANPNPLLAPFEITRSRGPSIELLTLISEHLLLIGNTNVADSLASKILKSDEERSEWTKKSCIVRTIHEHHIRICNGDTVSSMSFLKTNFEELEALIRTNALLDLMIDLLTVHMCSILADGCVFVYQGGEIEGEKKIIKEMATRVKLSLSFISEYIKPLEEKRNANSERNPLQKNKIKTPKSNRLASTCVYASTIMISSKGGKSLSLRSMLTETASPYSSFFLPAFAQGAACSFKSIMSELKNIEKESTLSKVLRAGEKAIGPLTALAESGSWPSPLSDDPLLPVDIPLDTDLIFHSIFICPVSRVEERKGLLLKCGHIIGLSACTTLSTRGGRSYPSEFKCPICPETHCSVSDSLLLDFSL